MQDIKFRCKTEVIQPFHTFIRSFVLLYGLNLNLKIFNFQNKTSFYLEKKTYKVTIPNNTGTDLLQSVIIRG